MEKEVSRKKHRKRSRFWFGYRIYLIVLAVLLVIMWFAVWNTMKKYEADCENLLFTIMLKFMFVLNIWLYLLAVAGFVYVSIAFVNYDILI